jgi:drug/metabolite transporter superfamily protein YnfA
MSSPVIEAAVYDYKTKHYVQITELQKCRLLGCYAVWLLLNTDVSEELSASFIRVTRIGELGTKLALTSNRYFFAACVGLLVTASVVLSSPILVTLVGTYKSHTV